MKAMKYIGLLLVAAILLLVLVAKFSIVVSRFECAGKVTSEGSSQPVSIFIKLEEVRWWVGLWSDLDASAWLEIPNEFFDYYPRVVEVGDQLVIFDSQKALQGNFSRLSKALALKIPRGLFEGTCKRVD